MAIVSRIDLVYLYVRDFQRSLEFYRDVLGLPLAVSAGRSWAEARLPGGLRFAIVEADDYEPPTPRTVEISFSTDSLEAARTALAAADVPVSEFERMEWGDHFHFWDPDGYRLSFFTSPSS